MDKHWTAKISTGRNAKTVNFAVPLICFRENPANFRPFRFNLTIEKTDGSEMSWMAKHPLELRLTFGTDNPADLGWMLIK